MPVIVILMYEIKIYSQKRTKPRRLFDTLTEIQFFENEKKSNLPTRVQDSEGYHIWSSSLELDSGKELYANI